MPLSSAPNPTERAVLEQRLAIVEDGCVPGDQQAMKAAVKFMITGYLSVRLEEKQADIVTVAYVTHLLHFPLWAVQQGCRACAARDNPFPVNPGELRAAVEKLVTPVRQERFDIKAILTAETYAPLGEAEVARRKAMADEISAKMRLANMKAQPVRGTPAAPQRSSQQQAEDALAEMLANPKPTPTIGAEALRAMGLTPVAAAAE